MINGKVDLVGCSPASILKHVDYLQPDLHSVVLHR